MISHDDVMQLITHAAGAKQACIGGTDPYTVTVPRIPTAAWHCDEGWDLATALFWSQESYEDHGQRLDELLVATADSFLAGYRALDQLEPDLTSAYAHAEAAKKSAIELDELLYPIPHEETA